MTCIVGCEHKGTVYIGGDSAVSDDNVIGSFATNEKVFVIDNMIFGVAGSIRVMQVLKYGLKLPQRKTDVQNDMSYLALDFVDTVRKLLKDKNLLEISDNVESNSETLFLFGYNKHLYSVDTDLQLFRCEDGYAAIGSGGDVALGAMYANKSNALKPEEKILVALQAATHHTIHVRPKFYVLKLLNKKEKIVK